MHYYKMHNTPDESFILNEFRQHTRLDMSHILPYISESSIGLRKHFGAPYIHGITVTCPGFYGPQGRTLRLQPAFPHLLDAMATFQCRDNRIVNFEMETSAIYSLGKLLGHRCVSINCVVANRATRTFSRNHKLAVDHMISSALEIILGIGTPNP
jgi:uridine phosphorylase